MIINNPQLSTFFVSPSPHIIAPEKVAKKLGVNIYAAGNQPLVDAPKIKMADLTLPTKVHTNQNG
jgi:hypothetical protein